MRSFLHYATRNMSKMSYIYSSDQKSYEDAVKALNTLQTNAQVLDRAHKEKDRNAHYNLPQTVKYLQRVGINFQDLGKLSVIHVSGTKGKGSTCAFCESILLHHGLKTGFYSSPHLVAVRERIRINGQPLSKEKFNEYFWPVYNALFEKKEFPEDMPAYFKFLTVMAFHVFIKEKVDVAIMEVGIGGAYDCTNVVRKPVVVGITSLGLDHTKILGDTVEKIAWHKAGIMKPNVPAITVQNQPPSALKVLRDRAGEIGCSLHISPSLDTYLWGPYVSELGLQGTIQYNNASLALQLCKVWIEHFEHGKITLAESEDADIFEITPEDALGLRFCHWPGRTQVLVCEPYTYFLDGAHTIESIAACVEWFNHTSEVLKTSDEGLMKILIFNSTGGRDPRSLLLPLSTCQFHMAIFCTNTVDTTNKQSTDLSNFMVTSEQEMTRCQLQESEWKQITQERHQLQSHSLIQPCIKDTLDYIHKYCSGKNIEQIQILVTGSLHLVGGVLSVIDPNVMSQTSAPAKISKLVEGYFSQNGICSIPGTP